MKWLGGGRVEKEPRNQRLLDHHPGVKGIVPLGGDPRVQTLIAPMQVIDQETDQGASLCETEVCTDGWEQATGKGYRTEGPAQTPPCPGRNQPNLV